MEERKIRVAITHGDSNGTGYEVILKTFLEPAMLEICTPIIYGSPKVAAYHRNALGMQVGYNIINNVNDAREGHLSMLSTAKQEIKVEFGQASQEAAAAAIDALDRAIEDCREKRVDVVVMLPVNNNSIKQVKKDFTSMADYIAGKLECDKLITIMANEQLRIASATDNLPLAEALPLLTKENIMDKAALFWRSLKRDFRISNPRIAFLSLNPMTDDGAFGKEEEQTIIPAISELSEKGVQAFGPYAASEFFGNGSYSAFDAVMAMYYDQATATFKAIDDGDGMEIITGLPIVCTAPTHGTDYDIAGQNLADENSFRHAIYLAIDSFRNRTDYDAPFADPLPKLYHERRDESEKVRFNIPKPKGEKTENKKTGTEQKNEQ